MRTSTRAVRYGAFGSGLFGFVRIIEFVFLLTFIFSNQNSNQLGAKVANSRSQPVQSGDRK